VVSGANSIYMSIVNMIIGCACVCVCVKGCGWNVCVLFIGLFCLLGVGSPVVSCANSEYDNMVYICMYVCVCVCVCKCICMCVCVCFFYWALVHQWYHVPILRTPYESCVDHMNEDLAGYERVNLLTSIFTGIQCQFGIMCQF